MPKPGKPVSLHPIAYEEAVADLLKTERPPRPAKGSKRSPSKKNRGQKK